MKKRYVSLILAAALSAAALAGCGGSGTEAPGSKETTGKEAAGQASAQDKAYVTFFHISSPFFVFVNLLFLMVLYSFYLCISTC